MLTYVMPLQHFSVLYRRSMSNKVERTLGIRLPENAITLFRREFLFRIKLYPKLHGCLCGPMRIISCSPFVLGVTVCAMHMQG